MRTVEIFMLPPDNGGWDNNLVKMKLGSASLVVAFEETYVHKPFSSNFFNGFQNIKKWVFLMTYSINILASF